MEERDDILIYSTPPLDHDLEVTGPVHLELFASSSAVDTDFTAKLVDVCRDGSAFNFTEGILRAKYRNSQVGDCCVRTGDVLKRIAGFWAYVFIAVALIGFAYMLWVGSR